MLWLSFSYQKSSSRYEMLAAASSQQTSGTRSAPYELGPDFRLELSPLRIALAFTGSVSFLIRRVDSPDTRLDRSRADVSSVITLRRSESFDHLNRVPNPLFSDCVS